MLSRQPCVGCAAWRADSAGNAETVEIGAFFRNPIDIRSLHIRMSMTTKISPTPIVSKDKENIRLFDRLKFRIREIAESQEVNANTNDDCLYIFI